MTSLVSLHRPRELSRLPGATTTTTGAARPPPGRHPAATDNLDHRLEEKEINT